MDSFLRKEKPPTGEGREKKGCGGVGETPSGLAKPGAGAVPENLLFNPQPRQRQSSPRLTIGSTAHEEVINGQGGGRGRGCGGSGGSGGSSASSYWEARTSKREYCTVLIVNLVRVSKRERGTAPYMRDLYNCQY